MKINPVFNFSNKQIQAPKKITSSFKNAATAPTIGFNLENLQAHFNVQFRGISLLDKITPPKFEDETLNAIFQRSTETATINTKDACPRSEDNAILTAWFDDCGLEEMQTDKAYLTMQEQFESGLYDGVNFEQRDKFYMMAVQRLIDCGAIDDKTFVLVDTGHSIPIAAQLMKEENKAALGSVKGTFLFDSTLPKIHPFIDPENTEAMETHGVIIDRTHYRLSSQMLSFGDIINNAYKNSNNSKGALFIGLDIHRDTKFDTSKLPTADELKKLGLKKIMVVQEIPPLSTFSQVEADKICPPLTEPAILRALSRMKRACNEAQKTPIGVQINETSKEKIKELLKEASDILKPTNIDETYPKLSAPDKKQTSKLIEKGKFGYGTKMTYGSDVNEYLRQIKRDSKGAITLLSEGASLLKLRNCPLEALQKAKDTMLSTCNRSFEDTVNGNFDAVF